MATITLPFNVENKTINTGDFLKSEVYEKMPKALKDISQIHPHLLEYLQILPVSQIGIPDYYPELNRKLGDLKEPNLIYPIGNGLFTHIMVDFKDGRNNYIQIEPNIIQNVDELAIEVENNASNTRYAARIRLKRRESQLSGYINKKSRWKKELKKKIRFLSRIPVVAKCSPPLKKSIFTSGLSQRD
jgi:hypothetical protein